MSTRHPVPSSITRLSRKANPCARSSVAISAVARCIMNGRSGSRSSPNVRWSE
jgi:hypothetical protein